MKMIGCNHFICHLFTECPYEGKSFILKLSIFLVFHLEGLEDVLL